MRRVGTWAVTVGREDGPCPQCGSEDWEARRPGFWEALWEWLRHGGTWRPTHLTCRSCGLGTQAAKTLYRRPIRASWWSLPRWVLETLRTRRRIMPVPLTYLGALGIGIVLGVVVQLVAGWPWWAVAIGFLVAVWTLFLSSALWHHDDRREVVTELLRATSPARATAREEADLARRVREAPFPLLGLPPEWEGLRYLGGIGHGGGITTRVELAHQPPGADPRDPAAPELRVEITTRFPALGDLRRHVAEELWEWAARLGEGPPPGDRAAWLAELRREASRRPDPEWEKITIRVDSEEVSFEYLEEGDAWVAVREDDGFAIRVSAQRFPRADVRLCRIEDPVPYLEGHKRRLEGWNRATDGE